MSKAEESAMSERTGQADEPLTSFENEGRRFRGATRVVQNGKTVAQRWSRQGLRAAQGLAGNARDRIKQDPVRSAVISVAIGLSLAALVAWRLKRHPSQAPNSSAVHD